MESWVHCLRNGNIKTTLEPVWRGLYFRLWIKSWYLDTFLFQLKVFLLNVSSFIPSLFLWASDSFCLGLKVAAMFKIGNSKELPTIPEYLSDEGKEFVRLCLQRNPLHRPTAAQLLEHPFVKSAAPLSPTSSDHPGVTNAVKSVVFLLYLSCFFDLY